MTDAISGNRGPERLSPLGPPENVEGLLGYIKGTLQALHGLRKQRNDGIRPELLLVHRTRLDGLIDTLGDCERMLKQLRGDSAWLMETWLYEYTDLNKTDHIVEHDCDFANRPDIGACDWHEKWFGIAGRNGMMEQFFQEDLEKSESTS